jgi:hypothetical protein
VSYLFIPQIIKATPSTETRNSLLSRFIYETTSETLGLAVMTPTCQKAMENLQSSRGAMNLQYFSATSKYSGLPRERAM